MYKALNGTDYILRVADGAMIPPDSENADWVAYQSWLAEGNDLAPADVLQGQLALPREAFCVALIGAGILTEAEAEAAALGEWPAKFEPALAGKTLVEKLEAKNLWRRITVVPRDSPLFLGLLAFYAGEKSLTEAQAQALGDSIFAGAS